MDAEFAKRGQTPWTRLTSMAYCKSIIDFHKTHGYDHLDNGVLAEFTEITQTRYDGSEISKRTYDGYRRNVKQLMEYDSTGALSWTNPAIGSPIKLLPEFERIASEYHSQSDLMPNTRNDSRWVTRKYFAWLAEQGFERVDDTGASELQRFIVYCSKTMSQLARQYNTAVVVIMHISKNAANGNSGDSSCYAIGSYAIAGIFRTLWTLGRLKDDEGKASLLRALCQSKNNYAEADPPALLFELRNGFRWSGVDESITAEDLFDKNKRRGRPADKKDDVKAEISRLLKNGEPMPSAELENAVCEKTGCHVNTFKSAKKDLGVESYQSGGAWYSQLPSQSTKNNQGATNG